MSLFCKVFKLKREFWKKWLKTNDKYNNALWLNKRMKMKRLFSYNEHETISLEKRCERLMCLKSFKTQSCNSK